MGKVKTRKEKPKQGEKDGKSGTKKIWGTKQVLASPFAAQMPSPQPGSLTAVLRALELAFPKPKLRRESRPNRKSNQPKPEQKQAEVNRKPPGFVLGINQVTKGLERDQLASVVVARDVMQVLVAHLPVLCFLKNTKMVAIPGTGSELAQVLGTQTVLAFGIQKVAVNTSDKPIARKIHDSIVNFAVKLKYPWLAASRGTGPVPSYPKPEMKPHKSIRKAEQEQAATGKRKRKRGSR